MKRYSLLSCAVLLLAAASLSAQEGFIRISDGKSFDGWKINENPESWSIEDGAFKANGNVSHLFYVGRDPKKPASFKNIELIVEVKTLANSNGGIYFHTTYQEKGFPRTGIESQVNNSHRDPQKTGGLYNIAKVLEAPAKDGEWFTQHIIVKDKHVIVKIDDKTVVDYIEPDNVKGPVKLGEGTFALQAHDPGSTVYFRNIQVMTLP
jgi:hypothetical protein